MTQQPPTQTPNIHAAADDPALATARAAGIDPADLSADDLNDLRASVEADAARDREAAPASDQSVRSLVPEATHSGRPDAISLLLEACERFGISPYADQEPQELLAWKFYPGSDDPRRITPDAVVLVTGAGLKLRHWDDPAEPMEPDTEERLRRVFHCFEIDPVTKQAVRLPLPDDLRLPAAWVLGQVTSTEHQYPDGYLHAGGAAAAADKQQRREDRSRRVFGRQPDITPHADERTDR